LTNELQWFNYLRSHYPQGLGNPENGTLCEPACWKKQLLDHVRMAPTLCKPACCKRQWINYVRIVPSVSLQWMDHVKLVPYVSLHAVKGSEWILREWYFMILRQWMDPERMILYDNDGFKLLTHSYFPGNTLAWLLKELLVL
jgi:hypothetical protein